MKTVLSAQEPIGGSIEMDHPRLGSGDDHTVPDHIQCTQQACNVIGMLGEPFLGASACCR
jgi:hypothetical protein